MSDVDELQELKNRIQQLEANRPDSKLMSEDYLTTLKEKLDALLSPSPNFERGDTVKWKKGLKNRKFPKEEQLCMVVEVLGTPKMGERDSGSPYFREPLNLVLALLDDEKKDLLLFHYDKRRFEIVGKAN